jgi:hypothetical protein
VIGQDKRDRSEYQRVYYEANKDKRKAARKKQPRTASAVAAEERYRAKKRLLREIDEMPRGPISTGDQ